MNLEVKRIEPKVPPLVVDLDGTLIRTDLLVELAFAYLGANPLGILSLPWTLSRGKAQLKAQIAGETPIEAAHLPYNERVLSLIRDARTAGQPVYLASASNERYVRDVADHLGLFDGWFASTESENLSASAKARRLVEAFGEQGFDYIGNDKADLSVWLRARRRLAVEPAASVRAALKAMDADALVLADPGWGPARVDQAAATSPMGQECAGVCAAVRGPPLRSPGGGPRHHRGDRILARSLGDLHSQRPCGH